MSTCYINESENKQKPELKYDLMTKADSLNPYYYLANPNHKLQSFNHSKLNLLAYYPKDYQNAFHFLKFHINTFSLIDRHDLVTSNDFVA